MADYTQNINNLNSTLSGLSSSLKSGSYTDESLGAAANTLKGISSSISTATLTPQTPFVVPPTPSPSYQSPTIVTPPQTPADTPTVPAQPQGKLQGYLDKISGLGDILGTKGQVTQDLQAQQQLEAKRIDQANTYNAYQQAQKDLKDQVDKIYSQPGITREQAQQQASEVSRVGNSNLSNLAIQAQAAQGLLTAAQQTIKDKLEAQFQPVQDQIDFYGKVIQLNQNDLTESEKFGLQQKADKTKNDLAIVSKTADELHQAILQNGAPQSVYSAMDKINNDFVAGKITAQEAQSKMYQATGNYGVDALKQAQLANVYSEINNRGKDASGGLDPAQLVAYANQYASTGQIPTGLPKGAFGLVAQVAKETPKAQGEIVDINTGVKSGKLTATQVDAYGALRDLTIKLDDAQKLYGTLHTGIVGGVGGNVIQSQNRQTYNVLRSEIVDLLARARTGAAISATEETMYKSKIPGTFNQSLFIGTSGENKLSGLRSSIAGKLDNGLRANGTSMYGFSTVKLGNQTYKVGDIIKAPDGRTGRVNPDGSITLIQ